MPIVRIEHTVPNFDKWKQAFDNDPADRKGSGVRRYQVFRAQDDPNYVMIDLEFESHDAAEAFLHKMERIWNGPGKAVMQNPRARIVESVEIQEL
jgi:quinol monooxygenase YgiN